MIHIKTQEEIQIMQEAGLMLAEVLAATLEKAQPGVSLLELDKFAEKEIRARGAEPSFQKVEGYRWTLCTCINDVVVHGIPDDTRIQDGDVVSLDCGVYHKGFHTDAAWTVYRAKGSKRDAAVEQFLSIGKQALSEGLAQVVPGNRIWDISHAVQERVEGAGYGVVRSLVGHGVGRELHEAPEVPNFVRGKREDSPTLTTGMTIAVEVIYTMGKPAVEYKNNDGWTIATKDGKIAGLFEATVALTDHGCLVLTPIPKD